MIEPTIDELESECDLLNAELEPAIIDNIAVSRKRSPPKSEELSSDDESEVEESSQPINQTEKRACKRAKQAEMRGAKPLMMEAAWTSSAVDAAIEPLSVTLEEHPFPLDDNDEMVERGGSDEGMGPTMGVARLEGGSCRLACVSLLWQAAQRAPCGASPK